MKWKLLILLILYPLELFALNAVPGAPLAGHKRVGMSLSPFITMVYGSTDELVFGESGPYPYLSQLHWEIQPAIVAGLSCSFSFKDMVFLNGAVGHSLNTYSGYMTDMDWIPKYFDDVETEWTNYSLSYIFLTRSQLSDFNLTLRYFNTKKLRLDFILGLKTFAWSWTDTILEYDYPYELSTSIVGKNGIDYSVEYRVPYIGGRVAYEVHPLTAGFSLAFSNDVAAGDLDHHIFRNILFYDVVEKGIYFGFTTFITLDFGGNISQSISYDIDWIPEKKGDTFAYSETGYLIGYTRKGAGMSYFTQSLGINLIYNF